MLYSITRYYLKRQENYKNHVRAHLHVDFDNEPINKYAFEIGNVQRNLILFLKTDLKFWIQSKQYDYGLFRRTKFLYTNLGVFLLTGLFSTATPAFHLKGVHWLDAWCSVQARLTHFQRLTWKIKDKKHRYFVLLLQNFPEKNRITACLCTSSCFHFSASSMRRPLKQSKVSRSDQVKSCFKVHNSFPTSEMWTQISSPPWTASMWNLRLFNRTDCRNIFPLHPSWVCILWDFKLGFSFVFWSHNLHEYLTDSWKYFMWRPILFSSVNW